MKNVLDYIIITGGSLLVALAVHVFLVPNDLVTGGISGLAIVLNKIFPQISIGLSINILNVILFALGFICIGSHFGARSLYASFVFSGFVWLFEYIMPLKEPLTDDVLLELIISMVLTAIGLAFVFRSNASTGGTDISAKILNKFFHIELGKGVLLSDLFVITLAFFNFPIKIVLYGIVGIFLNGLIVDYILNKFKESTEIRVIANDNHDKITNYIMYDLEKGATIYKAYGAYTGEDKAVITSILNRSEYIKLKKFIKDSNIDAFITVASIYETFGLGFESLTDE